MSDPIDFEKLRAERNEAIAKMISDECKRRGWDPSKAHTSFNPNSCYCACTGGGPCEHNFQGWREFEDGRGGETVCSRCGLGAMSHSLRVMD